MSSTNPDQYSEADQPHEPQSIQDTLEEWIDKQVIASCILNEMADQHLPLTMGNAKQVWYTALETLHEQLQSAVDRTKDRVKC